MRYARKMLSTFYFLLWFIVYQWFQVLRSKLFLLFVAEKIGIVFFCKFQSVQCSIHYVMSPHCNCMLSFFSVLRRVLLRRMLLFLCC
jgi:hypothetical protein